MPAPVLTLDEMRDWEQATWKAGVSEESVIQRVGRQVAQRIATITSSSDTIVVLAGKGHNGDDGRAALPHLRERKVKLLEVSDPVSATLAFQHLSRQRPCLIIDALFGIGLSRPLDDAWSQLIQTVNHSNARIVSVDIPSGLNARTGDPMPVAIEATATLTVGAPKIGLLQPGAWPYSGRIEVLQAVGLIDDPGVHELMMSQPGDFEGFPPKRMIADHKGRFGHLVIVAGSQGYHGAAVLAARGAAAAKPGLITLVTLEETYLPVASQLQSAMVHPWEPAWSLPANTTAVLLGPGLASRRLPAGFKPWLMDLWEHPAHPVVVDASALDWLPKTRAPNPRERIITPHPGEAARLLGRSAGAVQANRPDALKSLSALWGGIWVVLKGHQTLIGRAGSPTFVNPSGNPALARGGSGDVLAGFLAGLIAQPRLCEDKATSLRFGVWEHGAAADRLSESNWIIEDLPAALRI